MIEALRKMFLNKANHVIAHKTYLIGNVELQVVTVLRSLGLLTDQEVLAFYTWCVIECYRIEY